MARIKGGMNAKKKHNRTLKLAKGYRGARSKQYRVAKQSVMRALTSAYAGRKQRKRQMRQLWIARINAAARMNGLSYSKFMHGLKLANVDMNRKMLAELAVNDKEGFATLAAIAKGYRGARSKQYRVAKQSVMRALTSAYAGRKQRKRQMRQLWIARINAAARMNGLSYSKFMHGLKLANVDMNRKMLAELAVSDKEGFATLAALAKEKIA